ncbi:protein kinase domain-containing protein [Trichonephila clavipes]|nr:protein kinase domain-containing protein [Trichonephila clavipes]
MFSALQYPVLPAGCSLRDASDWTPGVKATLCKMTETIYLDILLPDTAASLGAKVLLCRLLLYNVIQHPEKLTVWCALWAGRIIGPYFFKNDEGHNVTINDDRYRAMITNFFIPELNNHDVQELWFQQDGTTCHTARATIDLLKDTFGDRLISRFGPVNWPPRSCDLTPLDYFLWGYVKSLVYADKPQTLDHLEDNIRRRVIADIRPQMLEKVIENWTTYEPAKDLEGMYPLRMISSRTGPGKAQPQEKLWLDHTRVTADREDHSIHHMAEERASTGEITDFFRH